MPEKKGMSASVVNVVGEIGQRRIGLGGEPLGGDAGIDHPFHRWSRPSRSRSSEGVCLRPLLSTRMSAANFFSSQQLLRRGWASAALTISRSSAFMERWLLAARWR